MTTFYAQALKEDIKRDYKKAIDLYIQSVEHEELSLESYLNLIVILIEISFDYGVSANLVQMQIYTQVELNDLYKYLKILIKKAESHFDSNEVDFWKYYIENYFKGLDSDQIKKIIRRDETNLVPYFQLYINDLMNDNDVQYYHHKIEELKLCLKKNLTLKNRYILSLIESGENQKRLKGE